MHAFYETPFLSSAKSFAMLSYILSTNTTYEYSSLVRELFIPLSIAEDLLMGDLGIALKSCYNLISLRIEGSTDLSIQLSILLKEKLPFIHRLELPGCYINDSFVNNLLAGCTDLRHIDLSSTNVTLASMPLIIKECKFLETLDMTGSKVPVKKPIIYDGCSINEGSLMKPYLGNNVEGPHLKRCNFSSSDITDQIIGFLVRHCTNLEALLLDNSPFITDSACSYISQHCPRLQILGLSYCLITDVGLQSIAGSKILIFSSFIIAYTTQ
jgi:Leucine-rich repeat (LRR) protein